MRKIIFLILISLAVPAFAVDLLLNKSDGDIWYASDVNSILNHLDGVLYPISPSTRNKIDDTCDFGSGTYRWKNGYFSGDLTVDTNTLYVDSANNRVGIGTTSPLTKLQLTGSTGDMLMLNNGTDSFTLSTLTSPSRSLGFGSYTQTPVMVIDVINNRVGIGTTSPSQKLELNTPNNAYGGIFLTENSDITEGYDIGYNNTGSTICSLESRYDNASSMMKFRMRTAGSPVDAMTILGKGNVGIGTTAPDKALEINSATGANLRLTYNDSNGSAANYADFSMSSGGDLTVNPSGKDSQINGNLVVTGNITGTLATAAQPNITSVGTLTSVTSTGKISTTLISEQMRLNYDASNYMSATVSSGGDLTLNPSGKYTNLNGNLIVTGNISGYLNNVYYAQFHISYWNMDSTASYYQVVGINDQLRVCGASVVIYKDDGSTVVPIERGGYWEYTESDDRFTIYRDTSGIFDSTDFDGTGEWRGRFTIFYTDTAARL